MRLRADFLLLLFFRLPVAFLRPVAFFRLLVDLRREVVFFRLEAFLRPVAFFRLLVDFFRLVAFLRPVVFFARERLVDAFLRRVVAFLRPVVFRPDVALRVDLREVAFLREVLVFLREGDLRARFVVAIRCVERYRGFINSTNLWFL